MHGDLHPPGWRQPALTNDSAVGGCSRRRRRTTPDSVPARGQVAADQPLAVGAQVFDALVVPAIERRVDHRLGQCGVAAAQQHAERQADRGRGILRQRLELALQVGVRAAQVDRLHADQREEEDGGHDPRNLPAEAAADGAAFSCAPLPLQPLR